MIEEVNLRSIALAGCAIALLGCEASTSGQAMDSSRPVVAAPTDTVTTMTGWTPFHGTGFTLSIPPDSRADTATSHPNGIRGTGISGPVIQDSSGRRGPSWKLVVASLLNPSGLSTDAWVDSLRREKNDPSRLDPDSLTWLSPPDTLLLGTQRALRLQPFCGDCEPYEIYTAIPGRMVVIGIVYDSSNPGDQTAQKQLYDRILATFRVDSGSAGRPSP